MLDAGVAMSASLPAAQLVGEIYPGVATLEMAVDAGVPIALSSDAHTPSTWPSNTSRHLSCWGDCGVREIAV